MMIASLEPGEEPVMRSIRFRTLGCYPQGRSNSKPTLTEVIQEMRDNYL